MADLFAPEDLAEVLRLRVDLEAADRCHRIASGWLRSATQLTAWPDPVPDDLFAWGVELAALAYENPTGLLASSDAGSGSLTWATNRRSEILAAAVAAYGPGSSSASGRTPFAAFPRAKTWPDPIRVDCAVVDAS